MPGHPEQTAYDRYMKKQKIDADLAEFRAAYDREPQISDKKGLHEIESRDDMEAYLRDLYTGVVKMAEDEGLDITHLGKGLIGIGKPDAVPTVVREIERALHEKAGVISPNQADEILKEVLKGYKTVAKESEEYQEVA